MDEAHSLITSMWALPGAAISGEKEINDEKKGKSVIGYYSNPHDSTDLFNRFAGYR